MRAWSAVVLGLVTACASIAGLDDPHDPDPIPLGAPIVDAGTSDAVDAARPEEDGGPDAPIDQSAPAKCDETGLVARFRFDEGSGTAVRDCTSNALVGTMTGADWIAGKVGTTALGFAPDDSVSLGNPEALHLLGAMTVSVWINASAIDQNGRIVSKSSQADRGWEMNVELGGTIEFKVASDGLAYEQAAAVFATGKWVHVAGVYEPGVALRLYFDGTLANENTTNIPAAQRDSPFDVMVGAMPNETTYHFDGAIDDVRIYKRALSASEVKALVTAQ